MLKRAGALALLLMFLWYPIEGHANKQSYFYDLLPWEWGRNSHAIIDELSASFIDKHATHIKYYRRSNKSEIKLPDVPAIPLWYMFGNEKFIGVYMRDMWTTRERWESIARTLKRSYGEPTNTYDIKEHGGGQLQPRLFIEFSTVPYEGILWDKGDIEITAGFCPLENKMIITIVNKEESAKVWNWWGRQRGNGPSPIINEPDGFRGIKWGTPFTSIQEGMNLEHVSSNTYWYTRLNDNRNFGGSEIDIYYNFWSGKFTGVSLWANSEGAWIDLLRVVETRFGKGWKPTNGEYYEWEGKETIIKGRFDEKDSRGHIFIDSRKYHDMRKEWNRQQQRSGEF